MFKQLFRKSPLLVCAGALFVFTSCGGEEPVQESEEANTEETSTEKINVESDDASTEIATETPEEKPSLNTPVQMNNPSSADVKINPPHGEPGHDCAVKVGDPLPSANTTISTELNQPSMDGSVKLNPPHGQPGHDCAVKVGEPLN
ncbi:hypothetical protein CW751_06720 [Brumimicrobium salinarum]|uniref:Secreted protein n=1 Tax=Brumimicrobium salinarum TaxID=2058658 RepID=A0A2I0R2P7_9FLAO|nr:hypothetical protein [Brumimicrobium salinarum]PKR80858.1 hypothetical protein CW751_06720 [Brumimicrobium salinarum]